MRERPVSDVPKWALLVLVLALAVQVGVSVARPKASAVAQDIGPPPSAAALAFASFGEPIALSKLMMLYLQAYDTQPGANRSFRFLDYVRVRSWLTRILALDPRSNYPLLAAGQVYGGVNDAAKKRIMYDFIYEQFLLDPNHRWRALADAAVNARHVLKDIPLARKYTEAIRLKATGKDVPIWARQLDIFLMADIGETKAARILLGGMLSSGEITDPNEIAFSLRRLNDLEAKEKK